MSHENSLQIDQQELASEYGRYVEAKSKNGFMRFFVRALVMPLFAMLIILTGAAFAIANFSPTTYTQAKDIIFANVDFEKITGQTDAINREILDSWLILNSENQQDEELAQEAPALGEQAPGKMVQEEQLENQPK